MKRGFEATSPLSTDVYVHSAVCTKVTNRPRKGYYDLCLDVGRRALERIDPLKIDSFYLASMEPALAGASGELAAALASELELMPKEAFGLRGTSSAGGIGCIPCFKDVASGLHRYSLLVSCEQMNLVDDGEPASAEMKRERRAKVQRALRGVIDPDDRSYGLSMILIGDMFESALNVHADLPRETVRGNLREITMAMYRRARDYPFAQFSGNSKTAEDYDQSPWVSPYYRRDDVVPISSGACAIVFAATPPEDPPNGRVVKLQGIGQGIQHPSLVRRFGPMSISPSIRRAIYSMLQRAGVTLEELRAVDIGFPHDAFPSITRMILKEIGIGYDEAVEGLLGGRFNPFGGLLKCGHPVGCSGELQLVRAYQAMTHDERILPDSIRPRRADTAFTVSVGAALTNIVALYLEAGDRRSPPPRRTAGGRLAVGYLEDPIYTRYEAEMKTLRDGTGVVLAATRADEAVALVQQRDGKSLACADALPDVGSLVQIKKGDRDSTNRVTAVLEERLERDRLEAFGVIPPVAEPHGPG